MRVAMHLLTGVEYRERRRAAAAAVATAALAMAARVLLVRLLPAAELPIRAPALELTVVAVVLAAIYLLAALHTLPAVLLGVLYALFFVANLEMLAAMDTVVEVQDAVFATHEVFLRGSATRVHFAWLAVALAVACGLYAVAAARAQRERLCVHERRSRSRSRRPGGRAGAGRLAGRRVAGRADLARAGLVAALGLAVLTLAPAGLTWQEDSVVSGSVRESLRRAGIGRSDVSAAPDRVIPGRTPAEANDQFEEGARPLQGDLDGELLIPRAENNHNVLILMLEGIPGVYLRQVQKATAVSYPVEMGALSKIADSGLIATQSVAHARQTIRGLYSAFTGDYPRLDLSTPKIYPYIQADERLRPPALPAMMRDLGYETVYLQAADLSYMSKDQFMPETGFEHVLGKEAFEYNHVPFEWGPDDKAYLEQVADFIDDLERERAAGKPWFLSLLTVGTHHPYGVSDEYAERYPSRKIAAVAYLDEALGDFFERLKADGHLENTAVFIVSDESHGVTGHVFGRYWGTTVIRTPELNRAGAGDVPVLQEELVGLRDLPISVLDYLAADERARAFAGRSFLRSYDTPHRMLFGPYIAKVPHGASAPLVYHVPERGHITSYVPSTGAVFAPDYARRRDCEDDHQELAGRLRSAYLAATHIPGVEYALARADDETVEPSIPRERSWVLMENAAHTLSPRERKMLTSAQYLEIPADSRATLHLELEAAAECEDPPGADGEQPAPGEAALRPALQVLAEYEALDLELPAMPALKPGEVFEARVAFSTTETLKRVWIDLRVQSLRDDQPAGLTVRRLSLELEPRAAAPADEEGANHLAPRIERFEVRPSGTASPADAARAITEAGANNRMREPRLVPVAHAGGRYAGATYTNSVEALEANAAAHRVFELDFEWTADKRLIGLHDWEVIFERLYGFLPEEPLRYDELRELESPLGVTPVDLMQLRQFLLDHPRAAIVTDVKADNIGALAKIAERIDGHERRIIPQVYHPDEFGEALELGYERIIWTLYRYAANRNPQRVVSEARALADSHGQALLAVAMPVAVVEDGTAARLTEAGIPSYAHTINSCEEYYRLRELGASSIYTDDLEPGACSEVPSAARGNPRSTPAADRRGNPGRDEPLTVLSFNVRLASAPDGEDGWEHRREMVFEVIADHDPDLAGLQEPELVQIRELRERFEDYSFVGRSSEDGADVNDESAAGKFNAVMYRSDRFELKDHGTFWFSEDPAEPGSRSWDAALPRICTWVQLADRRTGERVHLYNLHLDYASQAARENSTRLLLKRMLQRPTDGLVLVTGDFNANELNPALRLLFEESSRSGRDPRPLHDTFRAVHPDKEDIGTFHDFGGEPLTTKIDFVLAPATVKVLEAGIDRRSDNGRYPSDHFPVYATIR